MKTLKTILLGALVTFCVTACQNDEIDPQSQIPVPGENETLVDFELDASEILSLEGVSTRTNTPTYSKNNFKIYAFRQATDKSFKYEKTINVVGMTLTKNTAGNYILSGKDVVRIGIYKFLATYGTEQTNSIEPWKWASLEAGKMDIKAKLATEIFLPIGKTVTNLTEYDFKVSNPAAANEKVIETLKRAVSRVDIVFISARKMVGGGYFEQSYIGNYPDILGGYDTEIDLKFNNITWSMNYFGTPLGTPNAAKPLTLTLNDLKRGTGTDKKITIGTFKWDGTSAKATASPIFGSTYKTFDNVLPAHIRENGAHVFGPYLFPNAAAQADVSKIESLVLRGTDPVSKEVTTRTIPINDPFKLEQNKVTLIKVYVLQGTKPVDPTTPDPNKPDPNKPKDPDPGNPDPPTPPMVYETNVEFEVQITTAWLGSNSATAEID